MMRVFCHLKKLQLARLGGGKSRDHPKDWKSDVRYVSDEAGIATGIHVPFSRIDGVYATSFFDLIYRVYAITPV
jgi:hypothetical protein